MEFILVRGTVASLEVKVVLDSFPRWAGPVTFCEEFACSAWVFYRCSGFRAQSKNMPQMGFFTIVLALMTDRISHRC